MPTPTSWSPVTYYSLTGDAKVDALLYGTKWQSSSLTFSFADFASVWSQDYLTGYDVPGSDGQEPWSADFAGFDSSDMAATRNALAAWDVVSQLQFTEVAESGSLVGDLRFAYSYIEGADDAQAWAYMPDTTAYAGDVWVNYWGTSYTDPWTPGSYEFLAILHEIGHAIGLKHSFEAEGGFPAMTASYDSRSYTIMSYSAVAGSLGSYFSYEPTTPMVYDIKAIQVLYGVDTSHESGNSSYSFSQSGQYHQTIWDSGGTDTLSYVSSVGGMINLGEGQSSRLGVSVNAYSATGSVLRSGVNNIWIAYGTVIENAVGGSGNDTITGNAYANSLDGGAGNDSISAGDGADTLLGGAGLDTLIGGNGNDLYVVSQAGESLIEGVAAGVDTVQVAFAAAGTFLMAANVENAEIAAGVLAVNVTGSADANQITGNDGANSLSGGLGNDTLLGGAGADTLNGGAGVDSLVGGLGNDVYVLDSLSDVVQEGTGEGTDRIETVLVSYTLGSEIEDLKYTGVAAFTGNGNGLSNQITGGAGNDTLDGRIGSDTLIGGLGNDTYVVDAVGDVVTEAAAAGTDTISTGLASYSLAALGNVENLSYTGGATFTGAGNAAANQISGGAGNDSLNGADGNDSLVGGAGNDTLVGGTGSDTLLGGAGDDTYVVDVATDVVNETVVGSAGTDTVQVAFAAVGTYVMTAAVENAVISAGTLTVNVTGNGEANQIIGNAGANILIGGTSNDTLSGGAGNDTLNGGTGDDSLVGGTGNDLFIVDAVGDTVFEAAGEGTDRVETTLASYTLGDDVEQLKYTGVAAFTGTGNTLANLIQGAGGNDTLDGGAGNDTLEGGLGNDTYVVDAVGDVVTEGLTAGTDTISTGLASYSLASLANVENLTYTGGTDFTATGNAAANRLEGGVGNDSLIGMGGNDSLIGGGGNDTLNGDTGTDTLVGGNGDDIYVVDAATDVVTEANNEGSDTIQTTLVSYTLAALANVENLTYNGALAFNGTGNGSNNLIVSGSGSDILNGGDGHDTLNGGAGNDTLNGGAGDDTLIGGAGTNLLDGGTGSDTVQLTGNRAEYILTRPSIDTVLTRGTEVVTLRNIETIVFADGPVAYSTLIHNTTSVFSDVWVGSGANDTINGFAGNDSLSGMLGNDFIDGGSDNDTLDGGQGDDTLIGGSGNDLYCVDSVGDVVNETVVGSAGVDSVETTALLAYTLGANLENLAYRGAGNFVGTGNGLANLLEGGAQNDQLYGLAGNDTLNGKEGHDLLDGGDGSDTYLFRLENGDDIIAQNDTLVGSIDTIQFEGTGTTLITTSDVSVTRGYYTDNDLVLRAEKSGQVDQVIITDFFNGDVVSAGTIDQVKFVGGTVWTTAQLAQFALTGNADDNLVKGYATNDTLNGGAGNDTLIGGTGNDTLIGGTGNDLLTGGAGNDVYQLGVGHGNDTLVEGGLATDIDVLRITGGVTPGQVTLTRTGGSYNDLYLETANGDSLLIQDFFAANASTIERIVFDNGSSWTATQVRYLVTQPTAGDDQLIGYSGADKLNGGAGNDTLLGLQGSDTLQGGNDNDVLDGGNGNDVLDGGTGSDTYINDAGSDTFHFTLDGAAETLNFATIGSVPGAGETDVAVFKDVDFDQLWFEQVGNDLVVSVLGTSDSVLLTNWFTASADQKLDLFEDKDGDQLSQADVATLVTAMAGFDPTGASTLGDVDAGLLTTANTLWN